MKNFAKGLIVVALSLILVPLVPAVVSSFFDDEVAVNAPAQLDKPQATEAYGLIESVSVYDTVSQTVKTYAIEDYLVQAVLGTLSANAEPELVKAQAVLMYTYILGRRLEETESPTPELNGCDISTDTNKYLPIVSREDFIASNGDEALTLWENVSEEVNEVIGEYIAFDGYPIVPAYCFSCGGRTESALDVLGEDVEYLQSVESEYDSDYISEAAYSKMELFARITTKSEGITLLGEPSEWIVPVEVTPSGYVKTVLLDLKYTVSGAELAGWLNLPSARFKVSYSEEFERFTFEVSGSGHLVGLSQYGANEMARRGSSYDKILKYFFTGVTIEESVA